MNNSQHSTHEQALPLGHELQGYLIQQYLGEDDFSIKYQAVHRGVDVVLMEYFPRAIATRDGQGVDVVLQNADNQSLYAQGLAICRDELQDLQGFHHAHVLDTQHFFEANNTIYRVSDSLADQEWLPLEHYLKNKTLSENELKILLAPVLDGIAAIHGIGHIHSDLTPSTVLMNKHSAKPIITGFGDMRYLFRSATALISRQVSSGYSPLEHYFANESQGVWTDIYALGAIIYRIVMAEKPASSASRLSSLAENQTDLVVNLARHFQGQSGYSSSFLSAVDHALALQRKDRPQSIGEWRDQLGVVTTSQSTAMTVNDAGATSLVIEGVSHISPQVPSQNRRREFQNFETEQAYTSPPMRFSHYAPIAMLGGVISVLLIVAFIYLSPSTDSEVVVDQAIDAEFTANAFVVIDEEKVIEVKRTYAETDYQPILDVPLSQSSEDEHEVGNGVFFALTDGRVSASEFYQEHAWMNHPLFLVNHFLEAMNIDLSRVKVIEAIAANESETQDQIVPRPPSHHRPSRAVASRAVKRKQPPQKTREQYQREWLAKQQQLQKRAEWKKRKASLQKKKNQDRATQLEKEILADKDW